MDTGEAFRRCLLKYRSGTFRVPEFRETLRMVARVAVRATEVDGNVTNGGAGTLRPINWEVYGEG